MNKTKYQIALFLLHVFSLACAKQNTNPRAVANGLGIVIK